MGTETAACRKAAILTAELSRRPSRQPDHKAEAEALSSLAQAMSSEPEAVFRLLAEVAMQLTHSDSAGISVDEPGGEQGSSRWVAATGQLARDLDGTMPREASPFGEAMAGEEVMLLAGADSTFPALRDAQPKIHETLLAPFHVGGKPGGTVWAIKHSPEGRFDAEDARMLQSLARFAAAAHRMVSALDAETARTAALRETEERLAAVFEALPAGIGMMDNSGTLILSNPEMRRYLPTGIMPSQDERRRSRWRAWDERGRPVDPEDFPGARSLRGEHVVPGLEMLCLADDGEEVWTNVSAVPIGNPEGAINGAVAVIHDITAIKRNAQALEESEARLRGVLDSMAEGFVLLGPDFTILDVNKEALRLDGRTRDALLGRSHWEAFPGTEGSELGDLFRRAMSERMPASLEHRYVREDCRALWIDMRAYPARDGIAIFWRNVTDRREAEERHAFLLRLSDALRQLDDTQESQTETARQIGTYLAVDRAFYAEVDEDGTAVIVDDYCSPGTPSAGGRCRLDDFGRASAESLRAGRTLAIGDIEAWSDLTPEQKEAHRRRRIAALVRVPLLKEGRLVAFLALHSMTPREWRPDEVSLVAEVAERGLVTTERARAQTELRALAQRNTEILESISDAFYAVDADWRFTYVNSKAEEWCGRKREELLGKTYGKEFPRVVGSDVEEAHLRAAASRQVVRVESMSPVLGRWADFSIYPTADGGLSVYFRDITARKKAEQALRDSEERLATIFATAPVGLSELDLKGRFLRVNDQLCRILARSRDELLGLGVVEVTDPEDIPRTQATVERVLQTGGPVSVDKRYRKPDGTFVWASSSVVRLYGDGDGPGTLLAVTVDLTERQAAQQHERLLLAELQHRVRNILSLIRSIVGRTAETAETVEEYHQHLEGRISALARTQALLTRSPGTGIDLQDIILDELLAQAAEERQFSVNGDDILLAPKAAEVLTLATHELTTNSSKYGALSKPDGLVEVRWRTEPRGGEDWLVLTWTERGVEVDDRPKRSGFGTELIGQRVPYELRGHGAVELRKDGIVATIEFPLCPGESILQPGAGRWASRAHGEQ